MTRTQKVEVRLNGRPVWAEVRLSALEHNFRAIQRHVNPPAQRGRWRRVLAVVKANAYGHGAVPVAKALARAGVDWFARELASCGHLRLEGTFTHFASSDVFTAEQCQHQEKLFCAALERLSALGASPGIVHMANSAAVAARPSTWADMARPGAMLYGYHQFYDPPERRAEIEAKLPLQPALAFRP